MTKTKSTKRALLSSVLALVVCIAMLVGSTFAWFTDNASTAVNQIVAGNLDIVLEYQKADGSWDNAEGKTLGWVAKDGRAQDKILWEPGCTYELPALRVRNEGNLALKYTLIINGVIGDAGLLKVIDFTANGDDISNFNGKLYAKGETGDTSEAIVIKGHMQETAGNEYMNGTLSGISVAVFATHLNYENDSYGPDYDKNATYSAGSTSELEDLLKLGGKITLEKDITVDKPITVPAGVTAVLDLNGKSLSGAVDKASGAVIDNKGTLTITGGTVENTTVNGGAAVNNTGTMVLEDVAIKGAPIDASGYPSYAVTTAGTLTVEEGTNISSDRGALAIKGDGTTTINGGTFTNNDINRSLTSHVVDLSDDVPGTHTLTINGGTFKHLDEETSGGVVICNRTTNTIFVNGGNFSGGNYYGNDNLSDYGYGGTFSVKGGTYTAKPAAKYIADGYEIIDNGNGTYNVELITAKGVEIKDQLGDSTTTTVVVGEDIDLSKSEYQNGGVNTLTIKDGKTLDLNNNNISRPTNGSGNGVSIPGNATVTVKNGSITNESDNTGVDISSGATATFEDVDFIGKGDDMIRLRANTNAKTTIIFKGCTFTNAGVLLSGMNGACEIDVQFIDCTFTGTYKMYDENGNLLTDPYGNVHYTSRLINAERSGSYLCGNISFEKCKFDLDASESSSKKNVLEFKGPSTSYGKTMTVTLKDVTINGKNIVPVYVSTIYKNNITIVEEGTNAYTNNGVAVNYDGSAK